MGINRKAAALCAAALLLLSGCLFRTSGAKDPTVGIYRISTDDSPSQLLTAETVTYQAGGNVLDTVRTSLNADPQAGGMKKAFPVGVELQSCTVSGGVATAVMSAPFAQLVGIDRILAEYALTCTLMELDNVMSVNIVCLGETEAEGLTADDAVLADVGYEGCDRIVKLFAPDAAGSALDCRTVTLRCGKDDDIVQLALRQEFVLLSSVPDTTQILSVTNENGRCTVDLSEELFAVEPDSAAYARLVIGAICNTLAHLPNINSVVLEVNGREMTSYGGYSTAWPMSYNESLVSF